MATHRAARSIGPLILIAAGLVLIIGMAILALYPDISASKSTGDTAASTLESADNTASIPFANIPRISLEDAHAAWMAGNAVFVDVRGDSFYIEAHIPGALSISEDKLADNMDQLNKNDWIITYCT